MIKITTEINEIYNRKPMEKMNPTDNWFSGESNKMILIKNKKKINYQYYNEKGTITMYCSHSKDIKEYYKQLEKKV